jgi:hypothetical protein
MTSDEGMDRGRDRLIVVDAANVVGSRPDGWWRDRAGAARRLLERLAGLEERLPESAEVVVVLEGAARGAIASARQPGAGSNKRTSAGATPAGGDQRPAASDSGAADPGAADPGAADVGGVEVGAGHGRGLGRGSADFGGVRVVLAVGSGDDAIVDVVRAAVTEDSGRVITVVTADRGLRERVEALGASTVGPRWLWDQLGE